jgi:hypothetical protein
MIVTYIRNDFEQSLHALTTGRRYDAELSQMSTDSVDHRGLLADEELARAV